MYNRCLTEKRKGIRNDISVASIITPDYLSTAVLQWQHFSGVIINEWLLVLTEVPQLAHEIPWLLPIVGYCFNVCFLLYVKFSLSALSLPSACTYPIVSILLPSLAIAFSFLSLRANPSKVLSVSTITDFFLLYVEPTSLSISPPPDSWKFFF